MAKNNFHPELNKEQLEAIRFGEGPLLIIAGAGTGKTTVVAERIKYLITSKLANPEEILALTFTEKAANEMEGRIDEIMPLLYGETWISTFHSFCDRILRESAIHIGLDPKYNLMTQAESIDFLKKNIFDLNLNYFKPLGNPYKFLEELLQHFSRLQDECITPDEYLKWVEKINLQKDQKIKIEEKLEKDKWIELSIAYQKYNELKIKKSLMDFGDLITKTIELFEKRANILSKYQQKFKYILVDEFQDTNFAQNILINRLAQKYKNITVVGDDNQSIYRFRGAAVSNIMQFKNVYPNAKIITLNKNYRSTQKILDGAYKLIKHNDPDTLEYKLKISKKLISQKKEDKEEKIHFIHAKTGDEEAEIVAQKIIDLKNGQKYNWKDVAILIRANNHADAFIKVFEGKGIPHQFLGPSNFFERKEVADLIHYLKALCDPEDSINMYRLLTSDVFNISNLELAKIMALTKKRNFSFFELLAESENEAIINFLKIFNKHLKLVSGETAGSLLFDFIDKTGVYEKILEEKDDIKAKNIAKFFEKIKNYENENSKASIFDTVEYIDLLTETGESPVVADHDWQQNDAANILTVHSSKGLEFPVVFLVNLVNERFPSRERREQIPIPDDLIREILPQGDFHLQEERRLFYVGMTRAKERLYMTAAKYYGDGKREKKISPFVMEALGEASKLQLSITNYKSVSNLRISKNKLPLAGHQRLKINHLSVSQIETFKTCPMHYKLKYIYKLVTPPTAPTSFGISIHNTLKDFLETKKDIFEIYTKNWIEEGYLNKKHKNEFFEKGKNYLLNFLKDGYDSKIKTIGLEKGFKIKLTKNLIISGKIDRIDDLGNEMYEVIDYKTGASISTQKEVDKDLQLSVYSLAVSQMFNVSLEKIKLSLYFLDIQEKITTIRTTKQLEEVKKEVLEIKKEIEKSDFKCSNSYFCRQGCEFKMFCKSVKVN